MAGVGIPYDAERISSLDSHAAEIHSGKVFRIDLLADEPGSPVVIDARVAIPVPEGEAQGPYFVGSPLVDAHGRIVGLYSSPPLTAKAKSVDVHHFVEIGPVKLWLSGQATDSWVKPIVPVTP